MTKKRKRGAQPANQNARKHGLYASQLNSAQLQALELAEQMSPDDLQAEDVLAPLGLAHLLKDRHTPDLGRNSFGLTGRELEVLGLVAEGLRNREIADTLVLSPRTIERHLENCFMKMDVSGRAEAVGKATRNGLIGPLAEGLVRTDSGVTPDARLSA